MSAIASWTREHKLEVAWAAFAAANFVVLFTLLDYQTVPFHFVWVSLTLLYGARVWGMGITLLVLSAVCAASAVTLGYAVSRNAVSIDELTEIPLMSAMFLVMVWYARRRETALAQARQAASREREFIRDASHQLKTPIAVARGLADLLHASESSHERRRDIGDLRQELDRLGGIAERLLILEVTEQPDSLVLAPVEVEDLVVSAVRRWSRGSRRNWRVDVELEGTLAGDRERLDAALDAILENAVQATAVPDVVAVRAFAAGTDAIVEVTDSGVGIPAELLPRVFDRFSRGPSTPGKTGTGLGLPIAKAIVEAHGGEITAASAPGAGTRVTIRLHGLAIPAAIERPASDRLLVAEP
ncbi:sensor histidine kinase [Solirubrobacter soli]|uniref:sensor histidine kinase n=1 Tax=Solirubrobacter soli TaxID=363832 RepID=UPI00040212ED|nr:HAMP domain-containing sensor histidine kinase [Solirubrobacter soli]